MSEVFVAREPIPLPTCDEVEVIGRTICPAPRLEAQLDIDWEPTLVEGELGAFLDIEYDGTALPSLGEVQWKRASHLQDKTAPLDDARPVESDPWREGAPVESQFPEWPSEDTNMWVATLEEVHSRRTDLVCDATLPGYTQWLTAIFALISAHASFSQRHLWELIHPQRTREGRILPIVNPSGKYVVSLFLGGNWRQVMIDDRIPCRITSKNHIPVLPTTTSRSLWPLLLGKAILKTLSLQQDFEVFTALTGWLPKCVPLSWPSLRDAFEKHVYLTVNMETSSSISPDDDKLRKKKKRIAEWIPWIVVEMDEFTNVGTQECKQVRVQSLSWRPQTCLTEKHHRVVPEEDEKDEKSERGEEEATSHTEAGETVEAEEAEEAETGETVEPVMDTEPVGEVVEQCPVEEIPLSPISALHESLGSHGWWMAHDMLPPTMCFAQNLDTFTVANHDQWRTNEVQSKAKLLHVKIERACVEAPSVQEPDIGALKAEDTVDVFKARVVLSYAPRVLPDSDRTPYCYILDACEWFGVEKVLQKAVTLKVAQNVASTELEFGEGEFWFLVLESPNDAGSILSCFLEAPGTVEFLDIPDALQSFGSPILSVGAPEQFAGASAVGYNVWVKTAITVDSPVTLIGHLCDPQVRRHLRLSWIRITEIDGRESFPFRKPQTRCEILYQGPFLPLVTLPVRLNTLEQYVLLLEATFPEPLVQPDWSCLLFAAKDCNLSGDTLSCEQAQRWEGSAKENSVMRERIMAVGGDATTTLRLNVECDTVYLVAKLYVQHPAAKDPENESDAPQVAGNATDVTTYGGRHCWRACLEQIACAEGRGSLTFPHIGFAHEVVYILEVTSDPYYGDTVETPWTLHSFGDRKLEVGEDKAELQLEAAVRASWGKNGTLDPVQERTRWVEEGRKWEWEMLEIKERPSVKPAFTNEIKQLVAHCYKAPDLMADYTEEDFKGDYTVQPITQEVLRARNEEEANLMEQTAEKWAQYTTAAEEQLQENALTLEKMVATMQSYPWFVHAGNEAREALRTFISSRVAKQEALRIALMEADFNAEAINVAVQEGLDHKLDVLNPALLEHARKRVIFDEKLRVVQGDVSVLQEKQESGAHIVEQLTAAKAELEEALAKEIDEEAEEQEVVDAKAAKEAEVSTKEEAVKTLETEVAAFRDIEKRLKDDISEKHDEVHYRMQELKSHEIPLADGVNELQAVKDALTEG